MCRHITAEQQREGWRALAELVRSLKPSVRGLTFARRRTVAVKASG